MEYRSRLPGEPSLDHPGVPTGRLGHRAGLKTVGGIFRRFFCGLPALPAGCSDPGVGARSTGKHRSPQTAPRLQGPNIGSNEPGWPLSRGYARCLPGEPDLVRRAVWQSAQCDAELVPGGCGGQRCRVSVTVV